MNWLKMEWGLKNYFAIDCVSRIRGLALLWMKELDVMVLSYLKNNVNVQVSGNNFMVPSVLQAFMAT